MTDRQVLAATLVGAAARRSGRLSSSLRIVDDRVRREIEPALEDFVRELSSLRGTVQRAADVAGESWRLLNDMVREPAQPSHRFPGGQTSPF